MTSNDLLAKVERIQALLIAHATGAGGSVEYGRLREELLPNPRIGPYLPGFVWAFRESSQFWQFIKHKYPTYNERREFLWNAFGPLLDDLENRASPRERVAAGFLRTVTEESVDVVWARAAARVDNDPAGAITMARTLIETVCKHILDEEGIAYREDADLPKLYRMTAQSMSIAPSQQSESVFKQILGGCTTVVESVGALRNQLGDAHGKGKRAVKPAPRHAELAVNLAGSMAMFLLATKKASRADSA